MLTSNNLRKALIVKTNVADEPEPIIMPEAGPATRNDFILSSEDMAELERSRQQKINSERASALEEIIAGIKAKRENGLS